jgi:hypothetical protein
MFTYHFVSGTSSFIYVNFVTESFVYYYVNCCNKLEQWPENVLTLIISKYSSSYLWQLNWYIYLAQKSQEYGVHISCTKVTRTWCSHVSVDYTLSWQFCPGRIFSDTNSFNNQVYFKLWTLKLKSRGNLRQRIQWFILHPATQMNIK